MIYLLRLLMLIKSGLFCRDFVFVFFQPVLEIHVSLMCLFFLNKAFSLTNYVIIH